jgi:hypothetical protein
MLRFASVSSALRTLNATWFVLHYEPSVTYLVAFDRGGYDFHPLPVQAVCMCN